MINTSQTTTYNLTLSAEQFDALHELLDETIADYSSDLDLDLVDLNDIEIYQILLQMNRFTGGKYQMINTNNVSQNRGSEVINKLTDYSDNVNMYEEIIHYYNTEKYTVFPQIINNSCGKSIN